MDAERLVVVGIEDNLVSCRMVRLRHLSGEDKFVTLMAFIHFCNCMPTAGMVVEVRNTSLLGLSLDQTWSK